MNVFFALVLVNIGLAVMANAVQFCEHSLCKVLSLVRTLQSLFCTRYNRMKQESGTL